MPFKVTAEYLAAVTLKVFASVLTVGLALTGYGCGAEHDPGTTGLSQPPGTRSATGPSCRG